MITTPINPALVRDLPAQIRSRLTEVERRHSFSPASYGRDWAISVQPVEAGVARVQYEAKTPEGAVYLDELRSAGFFD